MRKRVREQNTDPPIRSGIGLNKDEWEEPERLCSDRPKPSNPSVANAPKFSLSFKGGSQLRLTNEDDPIEELNKKVDLSTSNDPWDKPTPLLSSKMSDGLNVSIAGSTSDANDDNKISDSYRYDPNEDDDEFDRNFYLEEEGQTSGIDGQDDHFLGNSVKFKEREEQMERSRAKGDAKIAGMSARRSQLHADQEAWEENRLLQSGVAVQREVQTEFDSEEDSRVQLIVHNLKPPFLDGRISFSMQQTTVAIVKDPTADMATNARKGSALMREVREKREQQKMRKRFWELGGTQMGDAMGISKPKEEDEERKEQSEIDYEEEHEGKVNYKNSSSFAKHMKAQKNVAQSQFAKTKSIQQQREYLPVFGVRSQLLDVVRENQVTVIVGETGSGKTTQLTQYLHEDNFTDFGIIGCTQPRRVAAM